MKTITEMLTTAEGCQRLNAKLAKLCLTGLVHNGQWFPANGEQPQPFPPNFLRGWNPEKRECDWAMVDGDLLIKLWRAICDKSVTASFTLGQASLQLDTSRALVRRSASPRPSPMAHSEHVHPVAALSLVAEQAGILLTPDDSVV